MKRLTGLFFSPSRFLLSFSARGFHFTATDWLWFQKVAFTQVFAASLTIGRGTEAT
jgi:hypothetical protein